MPNSSHESFETLPPAYSETTVGGVIQGVTDAWSKLTPMQRLAVRNAIYSLPITDDVVAYGDPTSSQE